jgi:hypothetical protein
MKSVRMMAVGLATFGLLAMVGLVDPQSVNAQGKKMYTPTGTGTIKGKVTLDGEAPKGAKLKIDPNHKDAGHCMKGDTEDQVWVTGAGNGLMNVVVYLKPPAGQSFKVDMAKKTWQDELVVDQPYCAFKPHVSVAFTKYDGKPTGQKVIAKNNAPILHNTRFAGNALKNAGKNFTIPAGKQEELTINPDNQPIVLSCDAHKWMEAFVWSFEHPYAAVTDKDGNFEIKNAPLGADVVVMAWHESDGKTNAGKEVKKGVKEGETIEYKVKKK